MTTQTADLATIRAALTDSYLIATRDESRLHGDEDAYACFQRALDGDDEALDQLAEEILEGTWTADELGLDLPQVGMREPGFLVDADTDETIRMATDAERKASFAACRFDGGAGIIRVDGRRCYFTR